MREKLFFQNQLMAVLFLFVFFPFNAFADTQLKYQVFREKTGDILGQACASFENTSDGGKKIQWQPDCRSEKTEWVVYDAAQNLETWTFKEDYADTVYAGKKVGSDLYITGKVKGKQIDEKLPVPTHVFIVNPKWGLKTFVQGDQDTLTFWGFRQDTCEPILMMAEKKGIETLTILGETVAAVHVQWGPKGFGRMFFSRDYWFRQKDGLFVQQLGSNGKKRVLVYDENAQ